MATTSKDVFINLTHTAKRVLREEGIENFAKRALGRIFRRPIKRLARLAHYDHKMMPRQFYD